MKNDTPLKDILLQILDAVDFMDDKEAFVKECIRLIYQKAISELVNATSQEQQEEINRQLREVNTTEELAEIVKKHFVQEQIDKELNDAALLLIQKFLESKKDDLTDEQKEKLAGLIGNFSEDSSISSTRRIQE